MPDHHVFWMEHHFVTYGSPDLDDSLKILKQPHLQLQFKPVLKISGTNAARTHQEIHQ